MKWGSDCRWCVPDRTKRRGGSPIQALQQQKGLSHLCIVDLHGRKPENANTQERVGAGEGSEGQVASSAGVWLPTTAQVVAAAGPQEAQPCGPAPQ